MAREKVVIDLEEEDAKQRKEEDFSGDYGRQVNRKRAKMGEGCSRGNETQTNGFAKVLLSVQEESMKMIELAQGIIQPKNPKDTERMFKFFEDRTKFMENLVELEKVKEGNRGKASVELDRDVERSLTKPASKRGAGRNEACSSQPAPASLKPTDDEVEKAKQESRKKFFPCPRCGSRKTRFLCFNHDNLSKDKRKCMGCQRTWIVGALLQH